MIEVTDQNRAEIADFLKANITIPGSRPNPQSIHIRGKGIGTNLPIREVTEDKVICRREWTTIEIPLAEICEIKIWEY